MNFGRRMKNNLIIIFICLIFSPSLSFAQIMEEPMDEELEEKKAFGVTMDLSSGYRHDDLQWSIAGNSAGGTPNVLSELTWTDLQSWQVQGKTQVILNATNLVFDGRGAYSWIFAGDNQDSDYSGNNRTSEFSRSNNSADKGHMMDISGGMGVRINFDEFLGENGILEKASITPLLGFSYNTQNLRMQNGSQTIPATGAFAGLNSTYDTRWYGPWVGFDLRGKIQKLSGSLRFEYHLMEYYAKANWNLRNDFQHPKSFDHKADGSGVALSASLGYALTDSLDAFLNLDFYNYTTDAGIDRTFYSSGAVGETQLNVVDWQSYSAEVGLRYSWL